MTAKRIVSFGTDPLLVATRRRLLATSFDSVAVTTLTELDHLPLTPTVDLLLLCHTLTEQQCLVASGLAHARWPAVQFLSLFSYLQAPNAPLIQHRLDAYEGPDALLRTISRILHIE